MAEKLWIKVYMNYENPPKRTTVMVPAGGYSVIRFRADNPGVWLLHCHVMSHLMKGQSVALWVTDQGIPPVPRNFPTCPIHRRLDFEESDQLVDLNLIRAFSSGQRKYLSIFSFIISSLLIL